ncbi:MAPEG family protein [Lysobacter silvisoli]|uniref:MAPEG family protein n=1 Tax=Lysobacter silvisoli TaxID=2293254 RepID=A0A371K312_9GAMM|nr:MAPEG family protein [Lysobacter silvisoli]RDZ28306.1 hypothetical protein DX914_03960 [Lysobacter silvisoli]
MDPKTLFLPAAAMAALSLLVWLRLYWVRIGQMRRDRIHPQAVATSAQAAARLTQSTAADNFRNLFELPVLFYLALTMAALTQLGDRTVLALAWAFVVLRVLHSLIHCGYNKVMHRFLAYVAGALVLWALWGYLAWGLLRA